MKQGQRFEEKLLRERLDGLDADHARIGAIIGERSEIKPDDISDLFLEARTKDAAYAASTGIVHEIRDVKIPSGAPVLSLVFQR